MMLRNAILSTGLALVLGAAQAGDLIRINPDAGGPDPILNVGSLGWSDVQAISLPVTGSLVAQPGGGPIPGSIIQTYGQGSLANFNNSVGNPIGGLTLNSAYEWTYVFGFQELVTGNTPVGGFPSATFAT